MKNKKLFIAIIIAVLIVTVGTIFLIFNSQDKDTTLNIIEKRWIENNKNTVIDFSILNDIAILNYEGDGIFFDFLESLEETTGLEFNKISYDYGSDVKSDYNFTVTKKVTKNDVLVYKDNYAILSKNNIKYNKLSEIKNLTIGVTEENIEQVNNYINNTDLVFKSFENNEDLINEMNSENSSVDAIILPKLLYLSQQSKEKLYMNYNIVEMEENYVISLGEIDKLNDIIRKYYKKWYNDGYDESFAKHFTSNYFLNNEVDEQTKAKFRSKRYVYGFVSVPPFDKESDNKLLGTNSSVISSFSKITNVEIIYKKYDNYNKLIDDFNANKVDFYFDMYKPTKYEMDTYKTVSPYDEQTVIITNLNSDSIINSISSLKGKEIITLKNTKISEFLKKVGANVKPYDTIEEIAKNKNNDSIIALDLLVYNYYSNDLFKNTKVDYQFYLDNDYNYVIRDIKDNKIFMDFLDFYLSFSNEKNLINNGYYNAVIENNNNNLLKICSIVLIGLVILELIYLFIRKRKNKDKNIMKKEDKLRYVDMLTSLKNRNYLNDNIEIWDESEIYPQTIIIVDLNNVAYVNDNYGHQEGDNVIKQAANILITNQMENSDIIRTNGNEFLIYLVEYDEKQIVSYIRKLNKEFKDLSYGFGAAIGYSMINDAIKTIDDAINEATLDMKNNKEELNN